MDFERLNDIVAEIKRVEGVSAIVLGGSRARGTQTEKSDIDLGIYYSPDRPLDLETLNQIATHLDDGHRPQILTPIGGWGPWINGGGWLIVNSIPVDFLYRDLKKVSGIIDACRKGQVDIFYQPGHPHGFVSSMYLAEIAVCKILWESDRGEVSALKELAIPYPAGLKRALIEKFSWEIIFSLDIAKKSNARGDVVYASGCCFRSAMCMLQTLFALNEGYWLNEKGAVLLVDAFQLHPENFRARIESAFSDLTTESEAINSAINTLMDLSAEIALLVGNSSKEHHP
jgi:predicted nucleotidyltransferase